jgi:hypothetical protein
LSSFSYYLAVVLESLLSVFGVRAPYEQPHYEVVGHLGDGVELRHYDPRVVVETDIKAGDDGAAFGRLFHYITGANRGAARIAMTVPVEMIGERIAMTVPVEIGGGKVMRFVLPREVVSKGAPAPTDPAVHITTVPAQTVAVVRFSGLLTAGARQKNESLLLREIKDAGRTPEGELSVLSYDPPFAIPFLRRNEIMAQLAQTNGR